MLYYPSRDGSNKNENEEDSPRHDDDESRTLETKEAALALTELRGKSTSIAIDLSGC